MQQRLKMHDEFGDLPADTANNPPGWRPATPDEGVWAYVIPGEAAPFTTFSIAARSSS